MVWAGVDGHNLHTERNDRWCCADLEIGHPRFRALGRALRRAGLGQQFLLP
jgi:hypothetical protein